MKQWKRTISYEFLANLTILTTSLLVGCAIWRSSFSQLRLVRLRTYSQLDHAIELNFNRPLFDSNKFTLEPNLEGKIQIKGRKLYYVFERPSRSATTYKVRVQSGSQTIQSQFTTGDRLFALIDTKGDDQGRLTIVNQTQNQKTVLTPPDLIVTSFEVYPQGDKILFAAYERYNAEANRQQLYTITTGARNTDTKNVPAGRLNLILDAKDYQNLSFDLADNGKTIVVQRVNRANTAENGLWLINEQQTKPIGFATRDFQVMPDGNSIAVVQSNGVAIVPLSEGVSAQFYENYGKIIGFSADGTQKLLVRYHADSTRSLMLVDDSGERELFQTIAPVIGCEFDPSRSDVIFCLKTDIILDGETLRPEPYISAINLKTGADRPIITLPNNQQVSMSMSPDGTALLFDQLVPSYQINDSRLNGKVWQLPIENISFEQTQLGTVLPQELTSGYQPQWIP